MDEYPSVLRTVFDSKYCQSHCREGRTFESKAIRRRARRLSFPEIVGPENGRKT